MIEGLVIKRLSVGTCWLSLGRWRTLGSPLHRSPYIITPQRFHPKNRDGILQRRDEQWQGTSVNRCSTHVSVHKTHRTKPHTNLLEHRGEIYVVRFISSYVCR